MPKNSQIRNTGALHILLDKTAWIKVCSLIFKWKLEIFKIRINHPVDDGIFDSFSFQFFFFFLSKELLDLHYS